MVPTTDQGGGEAPPLEAVSYLVRSEHRIPTLVALTVRPRSRSELWEAAGVSSSTIRRTLREFEDREWIRKDGYRYEATPLGRFVAEAMRDLLATVETERQLRDVWRWLPGEDEGFSLALCTDAVVTVADADDPIRPVNHFVALLEETDTLRMAGLDVALLEPCKDELCRRIVDGVDAELINPPRVATYVRSTCPALFAEALERGNLTVRLHDDLPNYAVGLLDDRVVVVGYDPDGVTVRVLVDTDAPDAREWAETTYERYRRRTPTLPLGTTDA